MRRPRLLASSSEDGIASIAVVTGATVLLAALVAGTVGADLLGSRSRAGAAADLAALAAAGSALYGESVACGRAAMVAAANGARLDSCTTGGASAMDADVVVSVPAAGPARSVADRLGVAVPRIRARALAGPARTG